MTISPEFLLGLSAAVALAILLVVVLRAQGSLAAKIETLNAAQATDHSSLLLQQQIEGLRDQFGRSLDANSNAVNQQLAQIVATVNQRLQENTTTLQEGHVNLSQRLDSAAALVGSVQRSLGGLEEANRKIYEVGKDIASLQQILQAPKLRGGLGELLLEDLLAQILPQEHFTVQHGFQNGQKVDAAIRLGNGIIPVDAKFPLENFRRLLDAQSDEERSKSRRAFVVDVKRHIDAVATKYILPDEGTFDFALMYIPAENVYYETVVSDTATGDADIQAYALARKVIPVSPGSFYAYLQAIVMGLRGMRIEARAHDILQQLGRLRGDFDRFRDDFRLIGKHLNNAASSFSAADRRLERFDTRFTNVSGDGEEAGRAEDVQDIPVLAAAAEASAGRRRQ